MEETLEVIEERLVPFLEYIRSEDISEWKKPWNYGRKLALKTAFIFKI